MRTLRLLVGSGLWADLVKRKGCLKTTMGNEVHSFNDLVFIVIQTKQEHINYKTKTRVIEERADKLGRVRRKRFLTGGK